MSKTAFGEMPEPAQRRGPMFIRLNVGRGSPITRVRAYDLENSDPVAEIDQPCYLELEVPASDPPEKLMELLTPFLGDFAQNAMDSIYRFNVLNMLQHAIR